MEAWSKTEWVGIDGRKRHLLYTPVMLGLRGREPAFEIMTCCGRFGIASFKEPPKEECKECLKEAAKKPREGGP